LKIPQTWSSYTSTTTTPSALEHPTLRPIHLAGASNARIIKCPPDEGLPTALTITLADGSLKDLKHLEDVHIVIFKDWAEFRKQVAEIDPLFDHQPNLADTIASITRNAKKDTRVISKEAPT
jgi:hypothetical protein